MAINVFLQQGQEGPSVLSELNRISEWVVPTEFLGVYAYATQSGAVAFDVSFGQAFWNGVQTKLLLGIDYVTCSCLFGLGIT